MLTTEIEPFTGKIPGEITQEVESDSKAKSAKRKRESLKQKGDDGEEASEDEDGPVIVTIKVPKLLDPVSVKVRNIVKHAIRSPTDFKVQDKACELLRKLATSPENVDKIILAGGVEMVSSAMSRHADKVILQAEACATISSLAWVDSSVAVKVAHLGVAQKILHCMEEFPTNAKVQQMGCGAFRALSYDGSDIVRINNGYGITATLNSIKRNPRKLAVQKEACCKCFSSSLSVVAATSCQSNLLYSSITPG